MYEEFSGGVQRRELAIGMKGDGRVRKQGRKGWVMGDLKGWVTF